MLKELSIQSMDVHDCPFSSMIVHLFIGRVQGIGIPIYGQNDEPIGQKYYGEGWILVDPNCGGMMITRGSSGEMCHYGGPWLKGDALFVQTGNLEYGVSIKVYNADLDDYKIMYLVEEKDGRWWDLDNWWD